MQSDPIGLTGGLNTYTYALSNPFLRIDPVGLWSGADNAMWNYFFSGGGGELNISAWCHDYLSDTNIQVQQSIVENKIRAKTKTLAGQLDSGQTESYQIQDTQIIAVSKIYALGSGFRTYNAECIATGDGCCATSVCTIKYSSTDEFKDPWLLGDILGVDPYGPIANAGGQWFTVKIDCDTLYSTTECK